jgi:hypothetical protein
VAQLDLADLGSRKAVGVEGGFHKVEVDGALGRWNGQVGYLNGTVHKRKEVM